MKHYKKGFTLIELLVVIAIIGILSTLAVVSLGNARQRARDSKRVSDIRNTQTALEIYYTDRSSYPDAPATGACTASVATLEGCCLDNLATGGGWLASCAAASRLITVSNDPRNTAASDNYVYAKNATTGAYSILFNLENGAGELAAGLTCAKPTGITNDATCAP